MVRLRGGAGAVTGTPFNTFWSRSERGGITEFEIPDSQWNEPVATMHWGRHLPKPTTEWGIKSADGSMTASAADGEPCTELTATDIYHAQKPGTVELLGCETSAWHTRTVYDSLS